MAGATASSASAPRYRLIYESLVDDIRSGRYGVMTLLPTEHELCAQFDASRHTVREAIRMLTEAGMVSRRPGVGTRVEGARPRTRFTQRISQFPDLLQYAKSAVLQVRKIQTVKLSARLAEAIGRPTGEQWLHASTVKLLSEKSMPVAVTDIYTHLDNTALRAQKPGSQLSLLGLIEDQFGDAITEVNQEFSATPIPTTTASLLHVAPKTAGLVITRRYYGPNATLLLATFTTFPHNKMKYSMSLNVG